MTTPTDPAHRHYASFDATWPSYAPSEILPGLFQGGTEDDHVVGCPVPFGHSAPLYGAAPAFDVVVTLYADAQPAPWAVEELRYGFADAHLTREAIERVVRLAREAHARWREGKRVLIRCQAGVNRSGLVMALTLMHTGLSAGEAIALIRERRASAALSNRAFVRWLVTSAHEFVLAAPSTDVPSDPSGPSDPATDVAA